jgi:hypothetical protein
VKLKQGWGVGRRAQHTRARVRLPALCRPRVFSTRLRCAVVASASSWTVTRHRSLCLVHLACVAPKTLRGLAAGPTGPCAGARCSRSLLSRMQGIHLARPHAKAARPSPSRPLAPVSFCACVVLRLGVDG